MLCGNLCILKKGSIDNTLCGEIDMGSIDIETYKKMIENKQDFTFCPDCVYALEENLEVSQIKWYSWAEKKCFSPDALNGKHLSTTHEDEITIFCVNCGHTLGEVQDAIIEGNGDE